MVGGKRAKIAAWTDSLIIANAPALRSARYGVEVVTHGGKATGSRQAEVTVRAPELSALGSESGTRGSTLSLSGHYFGSRRPVVVFHAPGQKTVSARAHLGFSDETLQVTVPKRLSTGVYDISVKNGAGRSTAAEFKVQ